MSQTSEQRDYQLETNRLAGDLFRKYFNKPLAAAEQDLLGKMIILIDEFQAEHAVGLCGNSDIDSSDPCPGCDSCNRARAILAQTKEPSP